MRHSLALLVVLLASHVQAASSLLTEIRLSWPLSESGNPFRMWTSQDGYLEFITTPNTLSLDFDVAADANPNVAALVANMRDGNSVPLRFTVGSFGTSAFESWYFGDFDAVDGLGLRRLDYATQDWPAFVTGIDWANFEIQNFHVTAVGPISPTLSDRALVVIGVWGRVPEPSTALLASTALLLPLRRRSRPRCR